MMLKEVFNHLRQASDFKSNWYYWASNQLAHSLLGMMLAVLSSSLLFAILGHFTEKLYIWLSFAVPYAAFEIFIQRQNSIRDMLEDFTFVCIYGGGVAVVLFDEVQPGSRLMVVDLHQVLPVVIWVLAHIAVGIRSRVLYEKYEE